MHEHDTERRQHDHVFAQDRVRPGESRTLLVVGITATMMVVEIAAGLVKPGEAELPPPRPAAPVVAAPRPAPRPAAPPAPKTSSSIDWDDELEESSDD